MHLLFERGVEGELYDIYDFYDIYDYDDPSANLPLELDPEALSGDLGE
jgi:hypothetical protein